MYYSNRKSFFMICLFSKNARLISVHLLIICSIRNHIHILIYMLCSKMLYAFFNFVNFNTKKETSLYFFIYLKYLNINVFCTSHKQTKIKLFLLKIWNFRNPDNVSLEIKLYFIEWIEVIVPKIKKIWYSCNEKTLKG